MTVVPWPGAPSTSAQPASAASSHTRGISGRHVCAERYAMAAATAASTRPPAIATPRVRIGLALRLLEDEVLFLEIEQRTRGNGDHQLTIQIFLTPEVAAAKMKELGLVGVNG